MPQRRRFAVVGLLALVGLIAGGRIATVAVPAPQVRTEVAATFRVPGVMAALPWPAHASGALVVPGVGTVGTLRSDVPVPIASVAKIMTALVVLADHPLGPGEAGPGITVTAAEAADYSARVPTGQSLLAVRAGERLTERQALEGLLLPSADNIADVLARWDGGLGRFVSRMNAAARAAGASATRYTDPSGLDPATVSTASDQVRIGLVALRSATLVHITGETSADLPVAGVVHNYNRLLTGPSGVFGLKTGSTRAAGGCLLFAARLPGAATVTAVGALLGVDPGAPPLSALDAALTATQRLITALRPVTAQPLRTGQEVARLTTAWGPSRRVNAGQADPVLALPGAVLPVRSDVRCPPPGGPGRSCGRFVVTVGDALSGQTRYPVPALLTASVPSPGLAWRVAHAF